MIELLVQLQCLTDTVYYEARNQPFPGQVAVAEVVLNRVESPYYPNTICEVVYQPYQFSWTLYNHGKLQEPEAYVVATVAAFRATLGSNRTMGSTHYHATYVAPEWAEYEEKTIKIEDHVFYR